eukprot:TRINITY_DN986_c0_g1_i1.p1 TRINITY_DN986_c0_g1~~TRINITY_DN986_c0_g1_i1.p1  ORF type:complete len:143 (-),score=14.06 TRINITY_DN986_c0_g1_i1:867-1295(-)
MKDFSVEEVFLDEDEITGSEAHLMGLNEWFQMTIVISGDKFHLHVNGKWVKSQVFPPGSIHLDAICSRIGAPFNASFSASFGGFELKEFIFFAYGSPSFTFPICSVYPKISSDMHDTPITHIRIHNLQQHCDWFQLHAWLRR